MMIVTYDDDPIVGGNGGQPGHNPDKSQPVSRQGPIQ